MQVQIDHDMVFVDEADWEYLQYLRWRTIHGKRTRYIRLYCANVGMHRILLNPPRGHVVDHINGNGLDNRRINLRIATPQQNAWNHPKAKRQTLVSSRYKGVSFRPPQKAARRYSNIHRLWRAAITVNGKRHILGQFASELEAALVYDQAATEHFGEFARLNF